MLTRLKVRGFKNLVDIDVRFGPFTCVAGANGVGKSNIFDAITLLSALASDTLMEAAMSVRDERGKTGNVRSLFHRVGRTYDSEMSFEAEMIVPKEGVDDLGQKAEASTTFLRYILRLAYREDDSLPTLGALRLVREELQYISLQDAPKHLKFPHSASKWRKSVLKGKRTTSFITTEIEGGNAVVKLRQDGTQGRPRTLLADKLPRTVLSTVNAAESPTALLARREMQSWRLLQLEPSALREPDSFTTPPGLGADGAHLPATLYHLAHGGEGLDSDRLGAAVERVYGEVAVTLSRLIDDVYAVRIDRDERRELLTLEVTESDGTRHPARSLSDGTLRFLALAVLRLDPEATGVICLEEPENGIHPERIPAILDLLEDIAVDTNREVGQDNPLRQVIVNTHSSAVVEQVPEDSLLMAQFQEMVQGGRLVKGTSLSWLAGTWRAEAERGIEPVATGRLLVYINPVGETFEKRTRQIRRVADRPEFQLHLPLFEV